jgi:hypothetical protein
MMVQAAARGEPDIGVASPLRREIGSRNREVPRTERRGGDATAGSDGRALPVRATFAACAAAPPPSDASSL